MSKPSPARRRTTNWPARDAALRERGSRLIWLDRDMAWLAPRMSGASDARRCSPPPPFSSVCRSRCCSSRPLGRPPGWWPACFGWLDWPVPDHTTLGRRRKTLSVQIPYRRAAGVVKRPVDSTGVRFLGDGEWRTRKHGAQGRRQWREAHLAMDMETSDIRAVECTPGADGDSPLLTELLDQIPKGGEIATVTRR